MGIRVGTDIVSIERVQRSLEQFGERFLEKFLNEEEIALAKKVETIAGFWAAKEAIAKALQTGIGKELAFKDIEIKKRDNNAPYFTIKREKFTIIDSSISISHDGGFAIAVVVIVLAS